MKAGLRAVRLLLFFSFISKKINDSPQTNYLKIYPTGLGRIFRINRTTAVDDQSQASFVDSKGMLLW